MWGKNRYPILHCLTDLADFHYFLIDDKKPELLQVELQKYVYIHSDLCVQKDVITHMHFISCTVDELNKSH